MLDTLPWCEPPQHPFAFGLSRSLKHRSITPSPCYRIFANNQLLEPHLTTVVCLVGKPDILLNHLDAFSFGPDPWAILFYWRHLAARKGAHTDVLVLGTACTPSYCMFICLPGGCMFERKRIVCIRIGYSKCMYLHHEVLYEWLRISWTFWKYLCAQSSPCGCRKLPCRHENIFRQISRIG